MCTLIPIDFTNNYKPLKAVFIICFWSWEKKTLMGKICFCFFFSIASEIFFPWNQWKVILDCLNIWLRKANNSPRYWVNWIGATRISRAHTCCHYCHFHFQCHLAWSQAEVVASKFVSFSYALAIVIDNR